MKFIQKRLYSSALVLGGIYTFYKISDYYTKSKTDYICASILSKLPFNFRATNISGDLFFRRTVTFSGLQISKDDSFDLEINRLSAQTSLWGLLLGPSYFFKSLEIEGAKGTVEELTDALVSWLHGLYNIKVEDSSLQLGRGRDSFSLKIVHLDTYKYGLSYPNVFSYIDFRGFLNDFVVEFFSVDNEEFGGSLTKDFINAMTKVSGIPEKIKHVIHFKLSNVLIQKPRRISIESDLSTFLKLLVFLRIPFVFDSYIHADNGFKLEAFLLPGRRYDLMAKARWKKFSVPRFVSENARHDQFFVLLKKIFDARSDFEVQIRTFYNFRQNVESNRAREVSAFSKVVDSIFAVGIDEIIEE